MVAKHFLECLVKEVRTGVVGLNSAATLHIDASHELCLRLFRQLIDDVDGKSVVLLPVFAPLPVPAICSQILLEHGTPSYGARDRIIGTFRSIKGAILNERGLKMQLVQNRRSF